MTRKTRITTFALATGFAATGLIALAGDLNPPVGPVAPTHKTLTEVEPRTAINATNTPGDADSLFKITLPGSYYLAGNITGVLGKHGVEIAASGVTLDLNGFDLVGVPGMGLFDGVSTTVASLRNIAVVNGSVRNWGDEGVDLGTLVAINWRVEGVHASGNGGTGIRTGIVGSVTNCLAYLNADTGIIAGDSCTVTDCSAASNSGNGINTGSGCTVTDCLVNLNSGNGISPGFGCTVSNCTAYTNTGSGISAAGGSTVTNFSAYDNAAWGILVSNGCTVADCTARANTLDGIACVFDCVIRGNTCSINGSGGDGAGIHATGIDNRIEGNNCTNADRGIDVDAGGNIIIRNTCSGNTTDWDIAANNVVGPILDRRAPASAAINGFSFAGSLGTTEPNANFSF